MSYSARTTTPLRGPPRTSSAGPFLTPPSRSPRLSLSLSSAGAASGQSDLGCLPKSYPSPSDSCNHDLGGLKILADKLKDASGKIIGVMAVHVTCPKCKGQPYLKGKYADTNTLQTAARNVSIPDYLPAAQALFERSGAVAVWPEE